MSLSNKEYHAFSQMCREFKEAMESFLATNEVYLRVQNYIKLANDNLDKFYEAICDRIAIICDTNYAVLNYIKSR